MENTTVTNLLNLQFSELDLELKEYAKANHVPIILDEGLALLETIIAIRQPKRILEIGTAIGYSAIRMHKVCGSEVYSIERNPQMYELAIDNVKKANREDKIHLIFCDALEAYSQVSSLSFDLIFIDAAKAQYQKFFDTYMPLLSSHGIIVCDNMLFHGLVEDTKNYENQSRSVRGIIRKLSLFHQKLLENKAFKTSIYNIGDGISISIKNNNNKEG